MNKQEVNLKSGGRACYFVAKVSDFGNAHRVSPIYFNRERAVLQLNYLVAGESSITASFIGIKE